MKHAGPAALDQREPLLALLRDLPELREKSRGTFYRGSRAFLHFHEDPAGLFADVRIDAEFETSPRCGLTVLDRHNPTAALSGSGRRLRFAEFSRPPMIASADHGRRATPAAVPGA